MNSIFKTISGIVFLALLLLFAEKLAGQIDEQLTERDTQKYAWRLSKSDSLKLANLPELRLPHHAMMHKNTLPDVWDNTVEIYFRPMFNDVAYECGQGSGIALGFNYELNFMRGTDASQTQNQIPTHFVYNFHNAGETYVGVSYFDSWEILKEMGSPSVQDYGGMHIGSSGLREKIWPDGYDVYYAGMHNRSDFLYSIKVNTPDGLETLKLWLYNHAGNSSIGGIANFYSKFMHSGQLNFLPAGTPEAGKYVVTSWGYSNHGMTIVGWNDSIRYDYNNDGQYTDSIDINNDGIIDMQDWENGGLIFANTYANPGGYSYANSGFCYMMYATLAMHYTNGGIWNNEVHVFTAKENCEPLLTWKIKLRHTCRNKLRIHVGVAADTAASIPDEIITFKTFNGEGGDFYLQGGTDTLDQYLEFGLDISELLNYVDSGQNTRYFFIVDEIDPNNEGEGDLVKLWLIDYTNGIDVSPCSYNNVPLNDDSTSTFSIVRNISFSPVKINTTSLPPAIVHAAYSEPISASGGDNPYYWELMYDYTETITTDTFPEITSVLLDMNSGQNGSCGQALDFDFPFYGEMIDSITISIDGFIMFEYDDYYWKYAKSSILMIKLHKILSPFLANMAISSSSGGVWYEGDSTQATFRWKSYLISQSGTDINFAIRLFPSGKIEIFYGDMIYDMVSEVIYGGISKGDSYNYYLRTVSNPGNVWPNMKIELLPRVYPDEMELTTDGYYVGTPAQAYPPTQLKIRVTDNVGLYHEREILFFTDGDYGLVLNEIIVESGNDEQIDYNETAHLDISIISVDTINITNSNFYISCSDPYISLVDSSETLSQITSLSTVLLQDAFSFNVSSDIPNEHLLSFEITVFSDNDTTIIPFELTAYSPVFAIEQIHILDGNNHILEPGETTYISAYIKNKGGSTAENLQFFLSTYDPYIDVIIPNSSLSVLNSGETDSIVFNLSAFNNTPNGHNANFMIDISANNLYPTSDIFSLQIGNLTEGWESTSNLLNWQYGNSLLWFVTDTTSWEGSNSLQSGAITHNQDSWFSIDGIVLTAGNISFYRKVSCEDDQNDNYDYLAFYIDNTEMERWDGEVDWSKLEYPVSAGMHTFKWNYHKDLSVDDGSDCAWVDLIELPQMDIDYGSMALALNTNDNEFCSGDSSQLLSFVDGLNQANFNYSWWPAAGLSNSAIPNPIAYPDTSTEYFLTIFDSNDTVSSSILITVNPVPEAPLVWADSLALHCSPNFEHQWYNMQGLIMGAIDSIYIPYASGDFYVIVNNEFQCFSEASNPFHFTHIGIVEIEDGFDIEIYPNPNNGSFYIELPEYKSEEIFLKIFDTGGKLLMDEIYNKSFINIKIPDAGQGIYFLQIKSENKIVNAKLIVL